MKDAPNPAWSPIRFAVWWLRAKPFNIPPHNETCHEAGEFRIVTVYRCGPFQVQFITAPPCAYVPRHVHPNVDSVECWVAGNGESLYGKNDAHKVRGGMMIIPAGEWHGDHNVGTIAVAWFSLQKWRRGMLPTSVELDWGGPTLGRDHEITLGVGV